MISICFFPKPSTEVGQLAPFQLPQRDAESWPELDVYCQGGDRLDFTLVSQARLSADIPNPAFWLMGLDADILLSRRLLITQSYYYFRFDQGRSTEHGQNLVLAATFKQRIGRFIVENRNRIVGFLILGGDLWAYGSRLRLTLPLGAEKKRLSLFAWDEAFFSNTNSWQRNRYVFGIHEGLTDRVAIQPYFLHQIDHRVRLGHLNAVGPSLKLRVL